VERHTDLLYRVQLADEGPPALLYLLFEHQSSPDAQLPFRLLRYLVRIWERWQARHPATGGLPPVVPLVLYHGMQPWRAPRRLSEMLVAPAGLLADLAPHTAECGFLLQDLSHVPDDQLKGTALLRMALLLLKHVHDPELPRLLPRWAATWRQVLEASGWQGIRLVLKYVLESAEQVGVDDLRQLFRNDLRLEAGEDVVMTVADRLRAEGREEGREEGRQEGREEGRKEGKRLLLRLLTLRFRELPEPVVAWVQGATPEELELWAERILTAASLDEVFAP